MAALALLLLCLAGPGAPFERQPQLDAPLEVATLDLAFLDARRLVVLSEERLSLYELRHGQLRQTARLALPGEHVRVRATAGLLRLVPGEEACWVLSNRRTGATLFTWTGGRLAALAGAEAIPPTALPRGAPAEGARFQAGTTHIALGQGLRLRIAESGLGVATDGSLLLEGEPDALGLRSGDALADLGGGLFATSGEAPPSGSDEIRLLAREAAVVRQLQAWPVEGRIRALAAGRDGDRRLLAVATDTPLGPRLAIDALHGSVR